MAMHTLESDQTRNDRIETAGRLIGIARKAARRAPMEEISSGLITPQAGLEGDHRGAKYRRRQTTVLAREDWEATLAEIGGDLPWTVRRANLFVEGIALPRIGGILAIGPVRLEVTAQTYPCARMEEAREGLMPAMAKDWRGGVTCRVLEGGRVSLTDAVEVLVRPATRPRRRLPG